MHYSRPILVVALVLLALFGGSIIPESNVRPTWCRYIHVKAPIPDYFQGDIRTLTRMALQDGCFDGRKYTWDEAQSLLEYRQ